MTKKFPSAKLLRQLKDDSVKWKDLDLPPDLRAETDRTMNEYLDQWMSEAISFFSRQKARSQSRAPAARGHTPGTRAEQAKSYLQSLYDRSGYARMPSARDDPEAGGVGKKGWEVRFVLRDEKEVERVRSALTRLGFRPGSPFKKHSRIVVPVYGVAAVRSFLLPVVTGLKEAHPPPDRRR